MIDPADVTQDIAISIDGLAYRLPRSEITAVQIRLIPNPPIGPDRDLWLEVPEGHDRLLVGNEQVALTDGMRLFTAPRSIQAGSSVTCAGHTFRTDGG
jgi:hypothetical protein